MNENALNPKDLMHIIKKGLWIFLLMINLKLITNFNTIIVKFYLLYFKNFVIIGFVREYIGHFKNAKNEGEHR